jgi:hypothetical protein
MSYFLFKGGSIHIFDSALELLKVKFANASTSSRVRVQPLLKLLDFAKILTHNVSDCSLHLPAAYISHMNVNCNPASSSHTSKLSIEVDRSNCVLQSRPLRHLPFSHVFLFETTLLNDV